MARKVSKAKVMRLQAKYAKKFGVDEKYLPYLAAQIDAESSFTEGTGSGAGARDIAQFMPGTAKGFGVTLGDNRIEDDIRGQVKMMAGLLRRQGSIDRALRGYNAGEGAVQASHSYGETNDYVAKIHRLADSYRGGARRAAASAGTAGTPGTPARNVRLPGNPDSSYDVKGQIDPSALLSVLNKLDSKSYDALDFASDYGELEADARSQDKTVTLPGVGGTNVRIPGTPGTPGTSGTGGGGGRRGRVVINPGADRPGVKTSKELIRFAEQVAGRYGRPLTLGTGSAHDRLTVNGNVSAHWSGRAGDFPLRGRALIKAGQNALIAAGMKPAQARKIQGGLFNVGGKQIIFNTQEGGDHTDHLHLGLR